MQFAEQLLPFQNYSSLLFSSRNHPMDGDRIFPLIFSVQFVLRMILGFQDLPRRQRCSHNADIHEVIDAIHQSWRKCYEYHITYQPTPTQLDQDNRFKPTDIDKALGRVKFPASSGPVLQVIQGIRDFEGQLARAMKGISLACVLHAKLLLHGVHVDLERLQSKKQPLSKRCFPLTKRMWKKNSCIHWKAGYTHGWWTLFPETYKPRHQIGHIP